MAEPTAIKVTLLAALAAAIGPLAAEYSFILAAAVFGGFVGLSVRQTRLPSSLLWIGHITAGAGLALLVTPLAAMVAVGMMPAGWAITTDVLLPVVAGAVGVWWHPMLTKILPGMFKRKFGGEDKP